MAIQLRTDFRILLILAKAVADAERQGNPEAISKAVAEHDAYKELCLRADKMTIGLARKEL